MGNIGAIAVLVLTWFSTHLKELGLVAAAIVLILHKDPTGWQQLLEALLVLVLGTRAVTNKAKLVEARKEIAVLKSAP